MLISSIIKAIRPLHYYLRSLTASALCPAPPQSARITGRASEGRAASAPTHYGGSG